MNTNTFHPYLQDVEPRYKGMSDAQIDGEVHRFNLAVVISLISVGLMNIMI